MGYLDKTSITVDAILTKRGRELLARNDGSFNITQFALGDDEIDYSLFNENHPNGTQFSAEAIENMPLIEAIPDGANSMNSKLITLSRPVTAIPYIRVSTSYTGLKRGDSAIVDPTTFNANNNNEQYIFTVLDSRLFNTIDAGTGISTGTSIEPFSNLATSRTVEGTSLTLIATNDDYLFSDTITSRSTSVIIEGKLSGARLSVPVTISTT
tara:strand:- start:690 stop:1322 length:633 start_codon:yes stop_codon:yes gene_type:complete